MTLPCNQINNQRRRTDRARKGVAGISVTCPASRHVHLMAEALAHGETYHMFTVEHEHCAESLLSVLESLWKARRRLAELEGEWYRSKKGGKT